MQVSDPVIFLATTFLMFVVIVVRYILVAGLFHISFYIIRRNQWAARKLSKKNLDKRQLYKEVKWSVVTSFIFAVAGAFTAVLWQKGFTRLYFDFDKYTLWYLPISLIISMLIHETYYYWFHRWMHLPKIFKLLHKTHHDSNTTSAWTAFSFHPFEAVLQAIILPLTIIFLPMNAYVLLFQLTIMTFSSVINHLEIETYPANFNEHFLGKWIIGATHHSLHHKQFKYNFGLYFTFWDQWQNTESPKFVSLFKEKTVRRNLKEFN